MSSLRDSKKRPCGRPPRGNAVVMNFVITGEAVTNDLVTTQSKRRARIVIAIKLRGNPG
jgi:hypothetical protein